MKILEQCIILLHLKNDTLNIQSTENCKHFLPLFSIKYIQIVFSKRIFQNTKS